MHGLKFNCNPSKVTSLRKEADEYRKELKRQILKPTAGDGAKKAEVSKSQALIKQKLINAIKVMQEGLIEREPEVRLLLLAAMSGEHILLIGPPGTAKSEVGRRLNKVRLP